MRGRIILLVFLVSMLLLGFGWKDSTVESQTTVDRPARSPRPNTPADVKNVVLSRKIVLIPCPYIMRKREGGVCPDRDADMNVEVTVAAEDRENDALVYRYEVSGGRIIGQGPVVIWDLMRNQPGTYTIKVSADDGSGARGKSLTRTVKVDGCDGCHPIPEPCPSCPVVSIKSRAKSVNAGETIVFVAEFGEDQEPAQYTWTISGGTIVEGQGTRSIKVATNTEMIGSTVKAAIENETGTECPVCRIESTEGVSVTNQ